MSACFQSLGAFFRCGGGRRRQPAEEQELAEFERRTVTAAPAASPSPISAPVAPTQVPTESIVPFADQPSPTIDARAVTTQVAPSAPATSEAPRSLSTTPEPSTAPPLAFPLSPASPSAPLLSSSLPALPTSPSSPPSSSPELSSRPESPFFLAPLMSKETTVESRAAKTPTNAPSSHGRGFWPSTALAYVDAEQERLRKEGEALGIVDVLPAAIIVDTSGESDLTGGLLVFGGEDSEEAEVKKFCEKEEKESGLPVIWKDFCEHPALRVEEGEGEGKGEGEGEGEEEGEDLAGEARQAQIVKLQPVPDRPGHFTTQVIFPPLQPISSPARHDSQLCFALAPTPSPLLREPVALVSHMIFEVDDTLSSNSLYCSATLKEASLQVAHKSVLLNATLEVSGNAQVAKVDFLDKVPYKVEEKEMEVSGGEKDPKLNVSGQASKDPHLGFEREGAEHSSGWRLNSKLKDWKPSPLPTEAHFQGFCFAPTTAGIQKLELEGVPLKFKLHHGAQSQDPLAHVELGAMLYKGGATRVTFSAQNCIYWMYHKVSSPIPGTAATTLEAKVVAEVISGETRSIAFEQIGYTATVPSSSPLTGADVLSHVVSETPRLARTKKTELLGLLRRTPYISSADIPTELPPTPPRGPMMRVPVGRQRSQSL